LLLADNSSKEYLKFAVTSLLSLLPSLLWILHSAMKDMSQTTAYLTRTSEYSFRYLLKAMIRTPSITSEHLGIFITLLAVIGIFIAMKNPKSNIFILVFSFVWFLLLFPFPAAYLKNAYYDYPALYGFCAIAGMAAVKLFDEKKRIAVLLTACVIVFAGVKTYRRIKKFDCFSEPARIYEPSPFYSAEYVSKNRCGSETVLVDYPQTMFYAGGDPAFVKCIYGDTGKYIKDKKYDFIILNYFGGYDFKGAEKELKSNGYRQVAPLAWKLTAG